MPISMMDELTSLGIPPRLVAIWKEHQGHSLLPLQAAVLDAPALRAGDNLLVIAPTSSGKTFVAEVAAAYRALRQERVLFLVPYRAIAEEHYADFATKYRPVGLDVILSTGERRQTDAQLREGRFDLAVLTYEKLAGVLVQAPTMLAGCGLVVIDELQMLMDSTRGPRLELLLTKLKELNPDVQLLGLSAVLDDLNRFDEWFQATVVRSAHRPIPLREGLYTPNGDYSFIVRESAAQGAESWADWNSVPTTDAAYGLAMTFAADGEQVLLFRATVDDVIEAAQSIARGLPPYTPASELRLTLNDLDDTGLKATLQECVQRGVGFHNADMTADERLLVEHGFRNGKLRIVVATSTLAAGVNLPAKTVIIVDTHRWEDRTQVPIGAATYQNMAGRAGRYRYNDPFGRAVLLCDSPFTEEQYRGMYLEGQPPSMESRLGDGDPSLLILDILASDLANSRDDIEALLGSTFGGFHKWRTPEGRAALGELVETTVRELVDGGCIEVLEGESLRVTPLGRIAVTNGLGVDSMVGLRDELRSRRMASDADVLMLGTSVPEGQQVRRYRVRTAEYTGRVHMAGMQSMLAADPVALASRWELTWPEYDTYNRLRAVCSGHGWMNGLPLRAIERATSIRAGNLRNFGYQLGWVVGVAADIAAAEGMGTETVDMLRIASERLVYGVDSRGLELAKAEIPRLGRERIMRLVAAGFASIGAVLDAEPNAFRGVLPESSISQLKSALENRITSRLERLRREHIRRLEGCAGDSSLAGKAYTVEGQPLEMVVEDLLKCGMCPFAVERIAKQNEGEPDLLLHVGGSVFAVSVTAKESNRGQVGLKKAVEVIGTAARFRPVGCIVVGRPEFESLAEQAAREHVANGTNFKLVPLGALVELFVAFCERRIGADKVGELLTRMEPILELEAIRGEFVVPGDSQ